MAGDYTQARQLGEASKQLPAMLYWRMYTEWSLAIAHCGLYNADASWRHLQAAWRTAQVPGNLGFLLAVAAVILARRGQGERAAEILGLVFTHRNSPEGWLDAWPLLAELRAALQKELGMAKYEALWARGQKLDIEATANEVLGAVVQPRISGSAD
jgi:hypothetical protein